MNIDTWNIGELIKRSWFKKLCILLELIETNNGPGEIFKKSSA